VGLGESKEKGREEGDRYTIRHELGVIPHFGRKKKANNFFTRKES